MSGRTPFKMGVQRNNDCVVNTFEKVDKSITGASKLSLRHLMQQVREEKINLQLMLTCLRSRSHTNGAKCPSDVAAGHQGPREPENRSKDAGSIYVLSGSRG